MFGLNVADKYASAVTKNSGSGGYSWLSSADHFLIMHLSSVTQKILQNWASSLIFRIIRWLHSFAFSSKCAKFYLSKFIGQQKVTLATLMTLLKIIKSQSLNAPLCNIKTQLLKSKNKFVVTSFLCCFDLFPLCSHASFFKIP